MTTPATSRNAPSTWRAGTLVYTSGGIVVLFLLLLFGDFAWAMRERSVGPMAQWYLKHLDVPNFLYGLLISSVPALIGLIFAPMISYRSDRHRGRRGRRIPFLLVTTPLAVSGMIGLAMCPILGPWLHQLLGEYSPGEMVLTLVCFGVFWTAFEFATIAVTAVFGGLVNDVVPQCLLGRFYGLFRAVSLIDGMIFNRFLIGKVETHYTLILGLIGLGYGIAFMWVCLKVREGQYPPPEHPPGRSGVLAGAKIYLRECFTSRYYLLIFLMVTAATLSFLPINTFAIPFAKEMGMSMQDYGNCLALTFFISLCLAFFIGWLADIFHPLRMCIASMAGYVLVAAWGGAYATTAETFSIALVLHGVLSGCYFTSAASLGQRLYPHSKFAQFASAAGILGSLGAMTLGPLIGTVIDMSGNSYRHAFSAGVVLAGVALLAAFAVHARFMRLGGPKNYTAP
ncbi:MFS transporter [Spartobacteria bacterium LR76]|nr:MFS transporter [Spartobacteria bacterium LR76]